MKSAYDLSFGMPLYQRILGHRALTCMKRFVRMFENPSETRFRTLAGAFFAILVAINYYPAFGGPIPMPGHLVTQFPSWNEVRGDGPMPSVGDIGDLIVYFYPFNAFSAARIAEGILPLWNKHIMSGVPFQAEPQTALFYPLHVVYYALSTPTAWTLSLMIRMWLAAMFMALLARSVGVSRAGSIVAGMVYTFSGFMVAWQGAVMGDTALWLPMLCYATLRLRRALSASSIALLAFGFAMSILAGHPETTLHVGLTTVAWALLLWMFPPSSARRFDIRFPAWFGIAGLLGVWLASIQLIPTLEWVRESSRNLHDTWPSFPAEQGLGFFSRDILLTPNSSGVIVPNAVAYAGMGTLILAALGTLHARRVLAAWWVGLVLFGAAATYGFEPVYWLLTHTPIVQGLKNERLILIIELGLAALAGKGVHVLQDAGARSTPDRRLPWVLAGLAFAAALYGVSQLEWSGNAEVEALRRPSVSLGFLLAGFMLVLWRLIRGQRNARFAAGLVSLLSFDLITFAHGYTSFTDRDDIFPSNAVIDFLRAQGHPDDFRVARAGGMPFASNSLIMYGLQTTEGYEVSVPPRLRRLTADFTEDWWSEVAFIADKIPVLTDRRLDLLNVKYLVAWTRSSETVLQELSRRFEKVFEQGEVVVYENSNVLPRAFLAPAAGIETIPSSHRQMERLKDPSFDPERTVIVHRTPPGLDATFSPGEFHANVERIHSDANGYRFRVEASAPAILVVSQNLYPGWKASTAKGPLPVFHANQALTGIAVPPGNHLIDLVFDPASLSTGMVLSIAGAIGLAVLLAFPVKPAAWRLWAPGLLLAIGSAVPVAALVSLEAPEGAPPESGQPELSLSRHEVVAGEDSYILSVPQLPNARVRVRYTIDDGTASEFDVDLNEDGDIRFQVGIETRKGNYRFLAFREIDARDWIPSNVTLVVN